MTDVAVCPGRAVIVFRVPGDASFDDGARAIGRKYAVGIELVDSRFSQIMLTDALNAVFAKSLALLQVGATIQATAQKSVEGGYIEIMVDHHVEQARKVLSALADRVRVVEGQGYAL